MVRENGSLNTDFASLNGTPCLRSFSAALSSSHSKTSCTATSLQTGLDLPIRAPEPPADREKKSQDAVVAESEIAGRAAQFVVEVGRVIAHLETVLPSLRRAELDPEVRGDDPVVPLRVAVFTLLLQFEPVLDSQVGMPCRPGTGLRRRRRQA